SSNEHGSSIDDSSSSSIDEGTSITTAHDDSSPRFLHTHNRASVLRSAITTICGAT
ncbi:hypothetical protein Dimus_007929, partial [Dionaea muscipula]